jgi:hypothetical protein
MVVGWLALWSLAGCIDRVEQVAGTGAVYHTRCSASMEPKGQELEARCVPPSCREDYDSAAVNHVVVALEPDERVIGYAERVCVQDLSSATARFRPPDAAAADGAAEQKVE